MNTEKMFVRSITGLPSTVLFAIYIAFNQGQAQITVDELMGWVMVKDDDSVRQACETLVSLDLIGFRLGERGKKHYHLTDSAQQFLPGLTPVLPVMPGALPNPVPEKTETGKRMIIDAAISVPEKSETGLENSYFRPENSEKAHQNPVLPDSDTKNQGSINLIDDDESLSNKNINHHQSEPENQKLAAILENTGILWGDHLTIEEVPAGTSPDLALGWVCKIWADIRAGNDIRNPTGLLRTRLHSGRKRRILHDDLLPDEYRLAIGLPVAEVLPPHSPERLEEVIEQSRAELEAEQAKKRARQEKIRSAVADQVRDSWRGWINGLDVPRAWIETWLDDTSPVRWDGRTLTVAARNEFAVNWLAERFSSCRILGIDAALNFVCMHDWLED